MHASPTDITFSDESTKIFAPYVNNLQESLSKLKTVLITANELNFANHYMLFQMLTFLKKIDFLVETRALMQVSTLCFQINVRKIIIGENLIKNLDDLSHKTLKHKKNLNEQPKNAKIFGVVDMKSCQKQTESAQPRLHSEKILKIIPKFMAKKCPKMENIPRLKIENLPNRKIGKNFS